MIAELSAAFVKLLPDEVDTHIENGLRRIVEFLGFDRSSLSELSAIQAFEKSMNRYC